MSVDVRALLSSGTTFLTFGGVETHLLFQQGFPLREFCAFEIIDDEEAWARLEDSFLRPIADAAAESGLGLLTDCLVWRASTAWIEQLGHGRRGVAAVNRAAAARMDHFLERWRHTSGAAAKTPVLRSADLGPRGDGYAADGHATALEAARYHRPQLAALADSAVDVVVALTMTSAAEAIGVVEAGRDEGLSVIVSATVETDGRLPDGSTLQDFILRVDDATLGEPVCYLVNCAHPSHLLPTLERMRDEDAPCLGRLRGLRANASERSHAELDNSTELDRGDPRALAEQLYALKESFGFCVVGGCCGTDAEHLGAIARRCAPA